MKCVRTVVATYGCKILQSCEYNEEYNGNTIRIRCELRMTPKEHQFMQHKGQLITTGIRSFAWSKQCMYKIRKITINILFL